MAHRKPHLPYKYCAHCGRIMVWRRKWRNNWSAVRYCGEGCRRQGQ